MPVKNNRWVKEAQAAPVNRCLSREEFALGSALNLGCYLSEAMLA